MNNRIVRKSWRYLSGTHVNNYKYLQKKIEMYSGVCNGFFPLPNSEVKTNSVAGKPRRTFRWWICTDCTGIFYFEIIIFTFLEAKVFTIKLSRLSVTGKTPSEDYILAKKCGFVKKPQMFLFQPCKIFLKIETSVGESRVSKHLYIVYICQGCQSMIHCILFGI